MTGFAKKVGQFSADFISLKMGGPDEFSNRVTNRRVGSPSSQKEANPTATNDTYVGNLYLAVVANIPSLRLRRRLDSDGRLCETKFQERVEICSA